MVATDEDLGWIELCQNGDLEAFDAVIQRYQHMVHSLAFRMSGSSADAEDLAQEIFIQAYRQLGSFRHESKFSSWLYRIAVNTSLTWIRRHRRREQVHRQWGTQWEQDAAGAPDPGNPPDQAQEVQQALLKLHPKQRAAIVLTVYEGLNHAEAARVLGCSETTVSWRLFAARAKLKNLLKHRSLTP